MKEIAIEDKKRSPISWIPTLYFAMGMPFVGAKHVMYTYV